MISWTNTKSLLCLTRMEKQFRCLSSRLAEVGKFEVPKAQGKYEAGQLFLHRVFGYRGVILFPWVARLFDRNVNLKKKDPLFVDDPHSSTNNSNTTNNKGVDDSNAENGLHFDVVTYYQALIDKRDRPHITAQSDAVTFLGRDKDKDSTLYAVPGLDYVIHEDVLPYISSSDEPFDHKLFEKFFEHDLTKHDLTKAPQLSASETLHQWQKENYKWLELSDVQRETTEGIRVTVIPFYMGLKSGQQNDSYWWRYCIRLENLTSEPVQLKERHWRIFSLSGTVDTVRGRGVVGHEPLLSLKQPAFQYSSHVSLPTPSGYMWGTYVMERSDGRVFEIRIPPFSLESKDEEPFVT